MSKVYSKSISVNRGIIKPKTTTNTNLTRESTGSASGSSQTTDISSVTGKNKTQPKRGCGCGRKK